MLKLTFWMNMPSFYQADLFRALLQTGLVELRVVFTGKVPQERAKMGWQDDLEGYEYELLDIKHPLSDVFRKVRTYRGRIHVVGGLWAGKVIETVLAALLRSRSKYFIYSEAPDSRDAVSPLKKEIQMRVGKPIVRNAAGLLPISRFAIRYFKSYGASDSRLHPFGYFRAMPGYRVEQTAARKRDGTDIIFVGQLVRRKGIDILLCALEPLFAERKDLRLHLVGSGELEKELVNWVNERDLSEHVIFDGSVSPHRVMTKISEADLLVLPSRWDGWGIVVNEALMAGVPVIVSDMCGAADVVHEHVNGYIFRSEDVEDLRKKLGAFLEHARSKGSLSAAAKQTGDGLHAENAARYLVDVLEGRQTREEDSSKFPWIASKP